MKNPENAEMLLSQKDIVIIVIYKCLIEGLRSPSAMLREQSLCKKLSRTYIYDLCRELKDQGYINLISNKYRVYYEINQRGIAHYQWYKQEYEDKFLEIKKVIDRIVKDLTGTGDSKLIPAGKELPDNYRVFFSKIVSVKDIIRFVILRELQKKRYSLSLNNIEKMMRSLYGWAPSSSYLYDVGYEMYEEGLVETRWNADKRYLRLYKITDAGVYHYDQIANSTKERVLNIQSFMSEVLKLFN